MKFALSTDGMKPVYIHTLNPIDDQVLQLNTLSLPHQSRYHLNPLPCCHVRTDNPRGILQVMYLVGMSWTRRESDTYSKSTQSTYLDLESEPPLPPCRTETQLVETYLDSLGISEDAKRLRPAATDPVV